MRIYYIFYINNYFANFYRKKTYTIYKMLESIKNIKEYDLVLSYKLYSQIAIPFNKIKVNEYILNSYDNSYFYYKSSNIHIIENLSLNERSKLVVGNANLKLKSNINYSTFLSIINSYSDNLFVCDFVNKDYFWLSNITKSSCQNKKDLVK